MARWIPPRRVIKNGEIKISAYIDVQITSKWLNIDLHSEQIHDHIKYFITTCEQNIDGIRLNLILTNLPEDINKWCQSFEGYIRHAYEIDRNQRERYHIGYVEHDVELHAKQEINEINHIIDTYDSLLPQGNGDLYKSDVYYFDEQCGDYIYLELKSYATEEEARNGHQELIKKWFVDNFDEVKMKFIKIEHPKEIKL